LHRLYNVESNGKMIMIDEYVHYKEVVFEDTNPTFAWKDSE